MKVKKELYIKELIEFSACLRYEHGLTHIDSDMHYFTFCMSYDFM